MGGDDGSAGPPAGWRAWRPAMLAVATRPRLWPIAVRQGLALAPTRWWRQAPHLPVPSAAYTRFRVTTQYGDERAAPVPADVVGYLEWCQRFRRLVSTTTKCPKPDAGLR